MIRKGVCTAMNESGKKINAKRLSRETLWPWATVSILNACPNVKKEAGSVGTGDILN
jgi:hypothetical protein